MKSQAQGRKRVLRLFAVAGCVVLVGAAAACAAKVDQKAPEDEVAAKPLTAPRHQHFRGPVSVVIEAARQHGDLTADQSETLDTIATELEADHEARRALHDKLKASAVAVVRSGTANSREFDQSVAEAVSAIEERIQKGTDALVEIHAILAPEQRAAVAAALRAQITEKLGEREGKKRHRDGFKRFASHLMLSKLQLEQLQTIKKELMGERRQLHPTREELFSLVDAFEGEDFATALNAFHAEKAKLLRARVATAGKRTDTVLSIFTKEQRELLADLILEGPDKVLLGERAPAADRADY